MARITRNPPRVLHSFISWAIVGGDCRLACSGQVSVAISVLSWTLQHRRSVMAAAVDLEGGWHAQASRQPTDPFAPVAGKGARPHQRTACCRSAAWKCRHQEAKLRSCQRAIRRGILASDRQAVVVVGFDCWSGGPRNLQPAGIQFAWQVRLSMSSPPGRPVR